MRERKNSIEDESRELSIPPAHLLMEKGAVRSLLQRSQAIQQVFFFQAED